MKKYFLGLALSGGLFFGPGLYKQVRRDSYVPQYVVQLFRADKRALCSGVHVEIGEKTYILSAAHCLVGAKDNTFLIKDDQMQEPIPRQILMEDDKADIVLIEALPNRTGIKLAKSFAKKEKVYTYTHGAGYETYKSQGTYIQDEIIKVFLFETSENNKCDISKPKLKEEKLESFFFVINVCLLVENTYVTDAFAVGGSSGGVVTDKYGDIIGLVSAGGRGFTYLVTLQDLQRFVENWK